MGVDLITVGGRRNAKEYLIVSIVSQIQYLLSYLKESTELNNYLKIIYLIDLDVNRDYFPKDIFAIANSKYLE